MKRPYRLGDWFAIPLGDGRYAPGIVARGTRKAIAGYAFTQLFDGVPSPSDVAHLCHEDAAWSGSFSDRAIVDARWPVIGNASFAPSKWPLLPSYARVFTPLSLERLVASGRLAHERLRVFDIRAPLEAKSLAGLGADARVQWRAPLDSVSLAHVEDWLARTPGGEIRLYGDALVQLAQVTKWPTLQTLAIGPGRLPVALPHAPALLHLRIEHMPGSEWIVAAFPHLRTLRIGAHAQAIDLRVLQRLRDLRILDCNGGTIEHWECISEMDTLEALRLARTRGWTSLAPLAPTTLRSLSIEHQVHLSDLTLLASMTRLEQLELRGLWQFNVDDVQWLAACAGLRRVGLDIGGRRKNLEVYRHGRWAGAWPFAWLIRGARDASARAHLRE